MRCIVAKTQKEIMDHLKIRTLVFMIEQQISWELEFDFLDERAVLFVAYEEDDPIGAGRVRLLDDGIAKVERICVLNAWRKQGVGKLIMDSIENYVLSQSAVRLFHLGAQLSAIPFYESLGYQTYGPLFLDAGIEHKMMKKTK